LVACIPDFEENYHVMCNMTVACDGEVLVWKIPIVYLHYFQMYFIDNNITVY